MLKFAQEGKRRGWAYLLWWVPVSGKCPNEDMGNTAYDRTSEGEVEAGVRAPRGGVNR
jgi:hypothetical protein